MATHPFAIIVDGVASGANILDDYSSASPTTPWVDPGTVTLTQDANGEGGSLQFEVIQVKTPAGGPWWKSGSVNDNARVRFQVSGTTTFLGYIVQINAQLAENGLGTRALVQCSTASTFLDKIIVYKGRLVTGTKGDFTGNFLIGSGSTTDQANVTQLVAKADAVMAFSGGTSGRTANRLIVDTATTPAYTGTAVNVGQLLMVPGTLRACLDNIKDAAEAVDGEQRRYWVAPSGRINYARLGTATPTYPTAPFKIVTTPTFSPYGSSSSAATLQARNLRVGLDHDVIVKKARFIMNEVLSQYDAKISGGAYTVADPYGRVYDEAAPDGAGMTTRNGPRPETLISVTPMPRRTPGSVQWSDKITDYGKKYFGTDTYPNRAAPQRSISFSVRGADPTNNPYGFANGYRQTAPSTFVLQSGWEAGQYVEINDATTIGGNSVNVLGLGGLYRIESLTMSFEPGSMIRQFDLTCERVPRNPLKKFLEA
jgi:hypothetical protein